LARKGATQAKLPSDYGIRKSTVGDIKRNGDKIAGTQCRHE
jgi:hypothetical protein